MLSHLLAAAVSLSYLLATIPAVCLCEVVTQEPLAATAPASSCCSQHAVAPVDRVPDDADPKPCLCAPPVEANAIPVMDAVALPAVLPPRFERPVRLTNWPDQPVRVVAGDRTRLCVWLC